MIDLAALPTPRFIDTDPATLTARNIAAFEQITGRTLYPAQVERLWVDLWGYDETLLRVAVQEAAKQNLLAYASGAALEHKAALFGLSRRPAQPAMLTLRVTRAAATAEALTVPAGAAATDGERIFALTKDLLIPAGAASAEGRGDCLTAGIVGNNAAIGTVRVWVAPPIPGLELTVTNTTESHGGVEIESDAGLRRRTQEAPESFSTCGSKGAYLYHARYAHGSVLDVAPVSPAPAEVEIYVLANSGMPPPELIAVVQAALSDERVRPIGDRVTVLPPRRVPYTLRATVEPFTNVDRASVENAVWAAARAAVALRRLTLGLDLVPSQFAAALHVPGVYRVVIDAPAHQILSPFDWPDCARIEITMGAAQNG